MPITDFSQLPSTSGGGATKAATTAITDFSQLPSQADLPKDTRLDLGADPGLSFDTQSSFTSEAGGVPILSKKGVREWKKYNTPGLPKPVSPEDLQTTPRTPPSFGEGLAAGSAELIDLIATGLFAMPLAAASEQLTRGQRAIEQGLGFGQGKNMTREQIQEEAAANAARINEKYGSPVLSTLRNWGILDPGDETPIEQGFSAAMERAGQLGENIQNLTKGQVTKQDVLSLVNLSFGVLGVKGVKEIGKARMSRAKAQEAAKWLDAVNMDASLRETANMQLAQKAQEAANARSEVFSKSIAALTESESKAAKKAREQARADARAAFAQEPGLDAATKSERGLELNEADRVQQLAEGMAQQREAQLPPQAGDFRGGVSPEAQSGMDKLARGKPLSLTDAERAALNLQVLPSAKKGFAADPKLLTAAAVGATGLGLAMAYEPDKTETALAIGAGALLLGHGKGLTLDAIRTAADDTPLRAFRDASATTLNTLENLPGNRSTFSKQSIAELLKRAEVTKAERDVLQPVLDSVPGDTITAKQLMAGVKERTGDFELKPVESAQYADYGLENIGRSGIDNELGAQFGIPEDFRGTPREATTTIYRSPVELGTNNHFNDPNYFAHTRSFTEDGVRHVVELQSDLAQKAGKVLTAEERTTLQLLFDRAEAVSKYLDEIATKDKPYGIEERNHAKELADAAGIPYTPGEPLKTLDRRVNLQLDELSAKLAAGENVAAISPMLKNWHKRLVREELARAARAGDPTVRFATADTVAKVEGWPSSAETIRNLRQDIATKERLAAQSPHFAYKLAEAELLRKRLAELEARGPMLQKEHQGIYDRYANEVEKFLKQLGGKPYTDSAGHTWIEVPVEGSKRMPAGPRAQQFGFADPKLLAAVAAVGGGIALGSQLEKWLTDNDKGGKVGSAIGAAIAGLGLLAFSHHMGVSDAAKALGRGADRYLGVLSTRVGMLSQPLLRRLTQHEYGVLKNGHERILAVAPFAEGFRAIKKSPERDALAAAILTNEPSKILPALGRLGSPALVEAWKQMRAALQATGEELKTVGRLKNLREDYFPRLVIDHEGLLKALGTEPRTLLEKALLKAENEAKMKTGEGLSPLERSNIINKFLSGPEFRGQGKAGFLKKRVLGEVTPELVKYYAPPDEAALLYMRAATREIERAKFFKDLALRDPETGKINIEASIGNVVNAELAAGRIKLDQVDELQGLLRSRFGNGDRSMNRYMQHGRNLTNLGLLGNAFAALTQTGDTATAVAANGFLPTLKAISQIVGRDPQRITMRDMGLVDHVAEEFTDTLSTAKALEKAFKYSGFSLVDQFGKSVLVNGALNKFQVMARTSAGLAKLRERYGAYLGEDDFGKLASDLRSGQRTPLVNELLFRELSNFQPISKIEVPQGHLDNPNGRILYMLKTFALKQIDIFRREAIQKMMTPGQRAEGTKNLLRFAIALGLSGASVEAIKNWLYGKDADITAGDVLLNFTKTYGISQYALDLAAQGNPIQALGTQILPPYKMWEQVITADPKALRYTPLVGPALYWHATQDAERRRELEDKRKERAAQ